MQNERLGKSGQADTLCISAAEFEAAYQKWRDVLLEEGELTPWADGDSERLFQECVLAAKHGRSRL